jgi:hypothetical protein
MCAHEVDQFRYPVDPELRKLEFHLCELAGDWRGSYGNPYRQEEIVNEYHTTMAKLYALGWDGTIDFECELPKELMPDEYTRRNPQVYDSWQWPQQTNEG